MCEITVRYLVFLGTASTKFWSDCRPRNLGKVGCKGRTDGVGDPPNKRVRKIAYKSGSGCPSRMDFFNTGTVLANLV